MVYAHDSTGINVEKRTLAGHSYLYHKLFHLLRQPQTSVIILAYFSTVFRAAHYPLYVRIWRYLPCGRWKKHTAPLKIAETVAPAVMSTDVQFQVGKIRPRRPTSPLLGHFRPFLANRIRSADGSI